MGGLLLRSFFARRPAEMSNIAAWTAIGTPWLGGGARSLEGLVAGYHLVIAPTATFFSKKKT